MMILTTRLGLPAYKVGKTLAMKHILLYEVVMGLVEPSDVVEIHRPDGGETKTAKEWLEGWGLWDKVKELQDL